MKKRLVIGMTVVIMSCAIVLGGCRSLQTPETPDTQEDRQEYAENAYELGLAESLAVLLMPPEEAAEVQEIIHEAMSQELSLEEQEEVTEKVFEMLSEYITTENYEGLDMYHQL